MTTSKTTTDGGPPADPPTVLRMPGRLDAEGWYHPKGSRVAHWMRAGRSLCGKHACPPGAFLVPTDSKSRATCVVCQHKSDQMTAGDPPPAA